MDTHGHHRVLQEGAAPRLGRAFAEKGVGGVNLTALFLGNWLADLSQVDDPGSTLTSQLARDLAENKRRRAVAAQVSLKVAAAFASARSLSGQQGGGAHGGSGSDRGGEGGGQAAGGSPQPPLGAVMLGKLSKLIRDRMEQVLEAAVVAMSASSGSSAEGDPASGALGLNLIRLVRVLGYIKFAHPESNPDHLEITYDSYARIFAELCRQYFPYEHLDRPLCSGSYGPTCENEWGERYAAQRDRLYAVRCSSSGGDAHLYDYLVDDRNILAGRLAELDIGWASVDLLSTTALSAAERDLWLARLGHTLHGVEDFFAHSTFTEHALLSGRGLQGIEDAIRHRAVRRVGEPAQSEIASEKVRRRFQRYTPDLYEPDSGDGAPEHAVATGYFDGWDTLNSLLHFAEELVRPRLFGYESRERQNALQVVIEKLLERYKKETVDDVLDLLKIKPLNAPGSHEQKVHQALDGLMDYVDQARARGETLSSDAIAGKASSDPVLRLLPPKLLREYLVPAVLGLTSTIKIAKIEWTAYKAIKALAEFSEDPVAYLLKPLVDDPTGNVLKAFVPIIAELIGKDLLVQLNYILLTELQDLFRAQRVGCHSLLAKDQPTEPLYDEMFSCARHVDWFVADTLCRWSDRDWVAATPEEKRWVRWDELLGFYLRSPIDTPDAQRRRVTWRQARSLRCRLVSGDQETLQSAYQSMLAGVEQAQRTGSYEQFLAANLGVAELSDILIQDPIAGTVLNERRVIDLATASGVAIATTTGHRLLPNVRLVLPVWVNVDVDIIEVTTWFSDVMNMSADEWRSAALGYERTRLTMSSPEFAHYTPAFYSGFSATEVRRLMTHFIEGAASIRRNLEQAYPHR